MTQTKRSFPVLLVISLCVNAIVLGILGGMVISRSRHAPDPGAQAAREHDNRGPFEERLARTALRDLPDEQREEMRATYSQRWQDARADREQMDDARETIAELLSAEPIDEAALTQAFNDIRDAEFRLREQFYSSLTETLMALPAERRADIVERSMSRREHRSREERMERRRDGWRPPPPDHGPGGDGPPPPPRD